MIAVPVTPVDLSMEHENSPDWPAWNAHFTASAQGPLPDLSSMPLLSPALRASLADSLAIFQLGESGEGRIAHQIDRVSLRGIDDDYRASLKRFVTEVGRHARILGQMVRGMGGKVLEKSWTEKVFRHGRRLMGVCLKLLVLLAAEVIAIVFYGVIAPRLPEGALRGAMEQITGDEDHHLNFHTDFFSTQVRTRFERLLFRATWWAGSSFTCGAVAWDHRQTLSLLEVPVRTLVRDAVAAIRRVESAVLAPRQASRKPLMASAA